MKRIVVGIGNPYLGDDNIGIKAAEAAAEIYNVEIAIAYTASLEVVDIISGYERAIIVDSIFGKKPGRVHVFGVEDLKVKKVFGTHSIGLSESLLLGMEFARMPEITIIAVEICNLEKQTAEVLNALPVILDIIGYELCWT